MGNDCRLVPEDMGRAGVDRHALAGQWPAGGDCGVDGVARSRQQRELRGAFVELVALEGEDRANKVRKRVEEAGLLQLATRDDGWKAERLRLVGGRRAGDEVVEREPQALELGPAPVHAGDAAVDEQAVLEEVGSERH